MKARRAYEEDNPCQKADSKRDPEKGHSEPEDVHERFLRELKRKGIKRVVLRF